MSLDDLRQSIAARKAALDALRPLPAAAVTQLRRYHDLELTFTSNAIEGNQLTARETAEVIEHGVTIAGKRLRDHLEAVDHFEALAWMRERADAATPIDESVVTELHRRIVLRSQPEIARLYSTLPRRILGSAVVFPNPAKIPTLMQHFGTELAAIGATFDAAFEAHLKLVTIHPFADGNGRTARLLMNLILLRGGYPPVVIRLEDRMAYLDAIEKTQLGGGLDDYQTLMLGRLDETLADYLVALTASAP